MSSLSSVGTNPNDPYYTLLQQFNGQNAAGTSTASTTTIDPLDLSTDNTTASASSTETHQGHHHHGLSGQIESAVTSALQSAAPGTDPNQTIQNAIETALKNGAEQGATQGPTQSSTQTGSASSSTSQATFNQTLQSVGVDPQQFQQDLQAALQNSNGTSSSGFDFATLFRSFPPGSSVNTVG